MDKKLKIVVSIFTVLFILFLCPFWKAISLASVFALGIFPCLPKKQRTHISWKITVAIVTFVTLLIVSPFILGIYSFSSNIIAYSQQENQKILNSDNLKSMISKKLDESVKILNLPIGGKSSSVVEKVSSNVADMLFAFSINAIKELPDLMVEILIFALSLYIFMQYGVPIKTKIVSLKLLNKKDTDELTTVLQQGSYQCLVTLLIAGGVQALVVLGGAAIAGFSHLFLTFIITFVLSFIPVIGAAPVAFVLAVIKLFQNEPSLMVFLIIVGLIAGSIDNIIKPILIQKGIQLDGAISLVIIIGSLALLGLPGLLIGPVVGSTVAHYFHKFS